MSTLPEEVQGLSEVSGTHEEGTSTRSLDSSPDIVLEHGSTRLSLDLDGWEWFWLFLAICFIGSLWIYFSSS